MRRASDLTSPAAVEPLNQLLGRVAAQLKDGGPRSRIEHELREANKALQAELSVTARLHEFSASLLSGSAGQEVLEEFLHAIVDQQMADAGTLLLVNRRTGRFDCVARCGPAEGTCTFDVRVCTGRERVVVEDSGALTEACGAAPDGHRAWQSTPLLNGAGELLGVLSTFFAAPHRASDHQLRVTDVYARVAAVLFERLWLEGERQDLLRQLVAAQEAERCRISRELHDTVAQNITGLMLGLSSLRAEASAGSPSLEVIERLLSSAELVGRHVHDLAVELRPTALDDVGLPAALSDGLARWSRNSGIPADFHAAGWGHARLSAACENAIYRIVLEALANVHRHAQATRVSVILQRRDDRVFAIVEDDGLGFEVGSIAIDESGPRLGLIGMKERAALVGGALTVESTEHGTALFVWVPVQHGS